MDGFELAEALRAMPAHGGVADHRAIRHGLGRRDRARPRRSASTISSPNSTAPGLIAAIKEQSADMERAA